MNAKEHLSPSLLLAIDCRYRCGSKACPKCHRCRGSCGEARGARASETGFPLPAKGVFDSHYLVCVNNKIHYY